MIRPLLFIFCSLFFLGFSRRALRNPRSHGFYRFFVFEGLLLLVLINHPYWFENPFSGLQIISWLLLGCSIYLVGSSMALLKTRGGRAERRNMPENHAFENTSRIVREGVYRHIRHPMYASLLFLGWGAFCKNISTTSLFLVVWVSFFLSVAARIEESENLAFFGSGYRDYMQQTRRFIPYLL